MQNQQQIPTPGEIWQILKEVSASQKRQAENWEKQQKRQAENWEKLRREQAEERKQRAEERKQQAEAWEKQRAEERKQRAEERKQRAEERKQRAEEEKRRAAERDEIHKRLAKTVEETNKAIDKSSGAMDNRWGAFVEALAVGKLISQLRERGIMVTNTSQNEKGSMLEDDSSGGKIRRNCEIDIIAKNAGELVAVEVKSTLNKEDVDRFLYVLENFHKMFRSYQRMRIRGAVAYLSEKQEAAAYAESKGLFVIKAVGDSSRIANKKSFKPKIFCSP